MKNICFVCPTVLLKRPIAEIISRLKGYEIGLLCPKKWFKNINNSLHYSQIKNAIIFTYSTIYPPFLSSEFAIPINPRFLITLFRILKRYDTINMWVPFYISNTILAILKKIFFPNKKLILTMDTIPAYSFKSGKLMDIFFKIYYKTIGKIVFSASNLITLYGESIKKYAIKAGIQKEKIRITPTGIDINIKKQDKNIRNEFSIKRDEKLIIFVGVLNHRKGIDLLIKTAIKLKSHKVKIIIIGGGLKKKYYQNLVKKMNLQDRIIFTDFRKDVYNFYHEADLFFLPSKGEGLPGVIMESMIYGVPIVSSNIPGTRDLIKDNENGFLCNTLDIDCYSKKILKLLKNNELKEKFIKNSKEKIKKYYSWNKNIERFKKLYK